MPDDSSPSPAPASSAEAAALFPPTPAKLAEALTRDCGGGDGVRLYLRQDLEHRLEQTRTGPRDPAFLKAAERLAEWLRQPSTRRWRARPWRWIFLGLLALIAGGAQQWGKQPGPDSSGHTGTFYSNPDNDPAEKIRKQMALPADQVPPPPTLERAALDGPAAYMEAIWARVYPPPKETSKDIFGNTTMIGGDSLPLPEDYEKTWQRLDPDNAQWLMLELQEMNEVLSHRDSGPEVEAGAAAKALELFERAARLPRCDEYWQERRQFALAAYRAPRCWSEADFLNRDTRPQIRVSGDWMFQRCLEEFARQGNQEALRRVSRAHARVEAARWRDLARRCPEMHAFELPMNFTIFSSPPEDSSAVQAEVSTTMSGVSGSASRVMGAMTQPAVWSQECGYRQRESRLLQRPEGIRALDLSEMCWRAEMALLALAAATWLGLCLVALRQAPWGRGMGWHAAGCLLPLARPARGDALAVALWGVAAPGLWVAGWLCVATGPFLYEFRWVLAAYAGVLGAVTLIVMLQARMARRLRVTGFGSGVGNLLLGRVVLALTASALPLLLARVDADPFRTMHLLPRPALSVAGGLVSSALLWLALGGFTGVFSRERSVRQILLARRLTAPMGIITVSLVLCATLLNFQERAYARAAVREMTRPAPCPAAQAAADAMWNDWRK